MAQISDTLQENVEAPQADNSSEGGLPPRDTVVIDHQQVSAQPSGENIDPTSTGDRDAIIEVHHCDPSCCEIRKENEDLKRTVSCLQEELNRCENKIKKFQEALSAGDIATQAENFLLVSRIEELEKKLEQKQKKFSFSDIEHNNALVSHYTGIPSTAKFEALVSLFDGMSITYYTGKKVLCLSQTDQIFLTLLKLRRNLSHADLGLRFDISEATVKNIIRTWISALHFVLISAENSLLSKVPSRQKNEKYMSESFREYPNTRIILDCTEVRAANPTLLSTHNRMFSSCKHYVTTKGLVGISPTGAVVFVSELYPGKTSDKDITAHSKVLDCLQPGDAVMADKGFLINSLLPEGVCINLPPFKETPQFTVEQVQKTFGIAKVRIHVERAIQRIKTFQILNYIPHYYLCISSEIFQVCAALTNFRDPLFKEKEVSNHDLEEMDDDDLRH